MSKNMNKKYKIVKDLPVQGGGNYPYVFLSPFVVQYPLKKYYQPIDFVRLDSDLDRTRRINAYSNVLGYDAEVYIKCNNYDKIIYMNLSKVQSFIDKLKEKVGDGGDNKIMFTVGTPIHKFTIQSNKEKMEKAIEDLEPLYKSKYSNRDITYHNRIPNIINKRYYRNYPYLWNALAKLNERNVDWKNIN